jgi:hypothetical protein
MRPYYFTEILRIYTMMKFQPVRFQVLTAASMKFRVFWDVVPLTDVSNVRTASVIRAITVDGDSMHL